MRRFKELYHAAALLVLNTVIVFIGFNALLAFLFWLIERGDAPPKPAPPHQTRTMAPFHQDGSPVDNGKRLRYQLEWSDFDAYGTQDQTFVAEVLDDFYELGQQGMAYQPWVLFSEPLFQGKHVTVEADPRGIPRRRTINPPNPDGRPVVTILALGGSTTFGYNVADEQTWSSYLAQILNERARQARLNIHVAVLNYGRGYYYPSQEVMLLVDLLRSGHRPDAVIFLDGMNWMDTEDVPEFYKRAEREFHNLQFTDKPDHRQILEQMSQKIPMLRLAQAIGRRLSLVDQRSVAQRHADERHLGVNHIINGFRQNQAIAAAICRLYAISPLFVLQPHAFYNYPVHLYRRPLPNEALAWRATVQQIYPLLMAEPGMVNLSGLFDLWGKDKKAIIDELHYSPPFHHFLAAQIADHIDLSKLHPRPLHLDEDAATGLPRNSTQQN